ncbi:mate-domain-containing protein [Phycomyces nitens]|nr:mate-domain-containing protein [Phycomyces nitens]
MGLNFLGRLKKSHKIFSRPENMPNLSQNSPEDERVLLLQNDSKSQRLYDGSILQPKEKDLFWTEESLKEVNAIMVFAWPLLATYLLGIGMRVVDVWFIGRLGPQLMAAVSLGNLFCTVGGLAMGSGMLTAIDTLVAQAFTGANHPHTLGIILQRALCILALFSIPVVVIWVNAEHILIYMGQDPELAHLAQSYILVCLPNIFPIFVSTCLRKFLQGLGQMRATMYVIALLFPLNLISNYIFLEYLQLGLYGAAYHIVWFHLSVMFLYILSLWFRTSFREYWPGWSRQAFSTWNTFLKLGIPGMLSVSTEWAFEVCAIITGVLGQTSLAAQSIVLSINSFLLMIPSALTSAMIVRLGHHLGADRPEKTRLCVLVSVCMGSSIVTINAFMMYFFRFQIAHHFTKDPQVIAAVVDLMGVASLSHFAAGNSTILSGTLNAFGKQHIVASFNLISYYAIGLPFGLCMTFYYDWGLIGVWSSVVMAGGLKSLGEACVIVFLIDWKIECQRAGRRISSQETMGFLPAVAENSNDIIG